MLITVKSLQDFKLEASDGEIGKVEELYFDDRHWVVRYLVANTGNWLTGRQVLLSPHALLGSMHDGKHIAVGLTKKQIEHSPGLDSHKPVSKQFEVDYYRYYDWPVYWNGPFLWGAYDNLLQATDKASVQAPDKRGWDPHLRSTSEVLGYRIQALDGEMGHVDDFIVDDSNWAIRYFVVNTKKWSAGEKFLVSTQWIENVSWSESQVCVSISSEAIKNSPRFTDDLLLTREYESQVHAHHNRTEYWRQSNASVMRSVS